MKKKPIPLNIMIYFSKKINQVVFLIINYQIFFYLEKFIQFKFRKWRNMVGVERLELPTLSV